MVAIISILAAWPMRAFAYGRMFDGGELQGIADECTCSGGMTINTQSYVDNSSHVYLYQLGATQLYANYNIMSSNAYFLTTLEPFAMCMVYEGEDCNDSSSNPEGMFMLTGTSFNSDKNSIMALLGAFPGAKELSKRFKL